MTYHHLGSAQVQNYCPANGWTLNLTTFLVPLVPPEWGRWHAPEIDASTIRDGRLSSAQLCSTHDLLYRPAIPGVSQSSRPGSKDIYSLVTGRRIRWELKDYGVVRMISVMWTNSVKNYVALLGRIVVWHFNTGCICMPCLMMGSPTPVATFEVMLVIFHAKHKWQFFQKHIVTTALRKGWRLGHQSRPGVGTPPRRALELISFPQMLDHPNTRPMKHSNNNQIYIFTILLISLKSFSGIP